MAGAAATGHRAAPGAGTGRRTGRHGGRRDRGAPGVTVRLGRRADVQSVLAAGADEGEYGEKVEIYIG